MEAEKGLKEGDGSQGSPALRAPDGLEAAARVFAEAWAAWHDHSGLMLDDDLITASNGILAALGLEMDEGDDGKHKLTPTQNQD